MKIGIIGGAGTVGSCAAYALASQGIADEIVLIDLRENIAASHATDIAASVTGSSPVSIKTGNYNDLKRADIIIIAVGLHYAVSSPLNERMMQNIVNISQQRIAFGNHQRFVHAARHRAGAVDAFAGDRFDDLLAEFAQLDAF